MYTVCITGLDIALEKYSGRSFGTLEEARDHATYIRRAGDPDVGRVWISKEVELGHGCRSGKIVEWV